MRNPLLCNAVYLALAKIMESFQDALLFWIEGEIYK